MGKGECIAAAKLISEFTLPSSSIGPDKLIPPAILAAAKGLAIITVYKAGFLVSIRGGTGVVVARTGPTSWSPPSCVALGGIGGGFEVGLEMTNFVICLNTDAALDAFRKGTNVTLGGNLSVALGPIGRNLEGNVALRTKAAFFVYSRTKGIFVGMSLEGSFFVERKAANEKMYGIKIRADRILRGDVQPPNDAQILYAAINMAIQENAPALAEKFLKTLTKTKPERPERKNSVLASFSKLGSGQKVEKKSSTSSSKISGSNFNSSSKESGDLTVNRTGANRTGANRTGAKNDTGRAIFQESGMRELNSYKGVKLRDSDAEEDLTWAQDTTVTALFDFSGTLGCDLSFKKGEVITVLTRTDKQNDWWEGSLNGTTGIFPANYVTL